MSNATSAREHASIARPFRSPTKGYTIADVLEMTVEQAAEVFSAIPQAADRLRTLVDVGLGYVKLGSQLRRCLAVKPSG